MKSTLAPISCPIVTAHTHPSPPKIGKGVGEEMLPGMMNTVRLAQSCPVDHCVCAGGGPPRLPPGAALLFASNMSIALLRYTRRWWSWGSRRPYASCSLACSCTAALRQAAPKAPKLMPVTAHSRRPGCRLRGWPSRVAVAVAPAATSRQPPLQPTPAALCLAKALQRRCRLASGVCWVGHWAQ
jgi:hypothetical protein